MIYLFGSSASGVEKDVSKAFTYFLKAHEHKHPRGSFKVNCVGSLISSKVGELIASGEAPSPWNKREPRFYFRVAVDRFCEQVRVNGNTLRLYGDSDTQYMMNDFRYGARKYESFYQALLARQHDNKFLKLLIDFADANNFVQH
jgi:TPR repeat protein